MGVYPSRLRDAVGRLRRMEHEVNVPFSVGSVRAALAEPERVARCVPGLQSAAGVVSSEASETSGSSESPDASGTIEGRLRLRVGGSTITYRGSLQLTRRGEEFAVEGDGTEARGGGLVRLALTVVPRRSRDGEGARLVCTGTVERGGRLAEFEQKQVTAAGQRLLERFGTALGDSIREHPPEALDAPDAPAAEPAATEPADPAESAESADTGSAKPADSGGIGSPGDNERAIPGIPGPGPEAGGGTDAAGTASGDQPAEAADASEAAEPPEPPEGVTPDEAAPEPSDTPRSPRSPKSPKPPPSPESPELPDRTGVFGADVPPPSLDPLQDDDEELVDELSAEAAHARRTMIGRSAEEVDHAPPRGRYAPVPVAEPNAASTALRWAAPAAAAVVAGAVVIGRVLRRRR